MQLVHVRCDAQKSARSSSAPSPGPTGHIGHSSTRRYSINRLVTVWPSSCASIVTSCAKLSCGPGQPDGGVPAQNPNITVLALDQELQPASGASTNTASPPNGG